MAYDFRRLCGCEASRILGYDVANRMFLRVGFQSSGTFSILRSEGWNVASLVWSGEVTGPDGQRTAIRSTQIREDNNDIQVKAIRLRLANLPQGEALPDSEFGASPLKLGQLLFGLGRYQHGCRYCPCSIDSLGSGGEDWERRERTR